MDHLLLPSNPTRKRIVVAYHGRKEYEGPFETYPARNGWGNLEASVNEKIAATIDHAQSFIQEWLFFGFLEEILGESMDKRKYIRTSYDDHRCYEVLSTVHLRSQLGDLHKMIELLSPESQSSRRQHIATCLDKTAEVLNKLSLENSSLIQTPEILSIALLCDLVEKSFSWHRGAFRASGSLHLGVSEYLQSIMIKDGWCRNDVYRLSHQLDLPSLYFASNLERPESQVCHRDCTDWLCKRSQIDGNNYTTQHDQRNCNGSCGYVRVPQEELLSILRSRVIPLTYYDAKSAPEKIILVPGNPGTPYVAISHVWSHGLGNPHDNSLPQCQLRRLSSFVRKSYDNSEDNVALFWLDTICFPVHSAEGADLAIEFMRKTYADADKVFVIDRYLEAVASKPLLSTECLVRILCSSWTRRLWTLQEGALAKTLYFQFADEPIEISHASFMMTAEMTFITNDGSLEYQPIASMIDELWQAWKTVESEPPRVVLNYLSGGLRWRATSVAADEPLCLSTLAALDMGKVMKVEPEARMVEFWSLLPYISAQVIFWSGPRLKTKGFRWAPASFLGQPEAILQDIAAKSISEIPGTSHTVLSENGLTFPCAGILLGTWTTKISQDLWIRFQNREWYQLHRLGNSAIEPVFEKRPDAYRTLGLIMKNTLQTSFKESFPENSVTCVIVSIYDVDEEQDIFFANTEDVGFLVPRGDTASVSVHAPLVPELVAYSERALYPARFVGGGPHQQVWQDGIQYGPSNSAGAVDQSGSINFRADNTSETRQELARARVQARDEDGRLAVDLDGTHYMMDGAELAEDQMWCLD